MKYYLIEGTETNCEVYLEEGGLLDVTPLEPNVPFGFLYREVSSTGREEVRIWYSEIEMSQDALSQLPDDESDNNGISNHVSSF